VPRAATGRTVHHHREGLGGSRRQLMRPPQLHHVPD